MNKDTIIIYDSVQHFIPYMEKYGIKVFATNRNLESIFFPLKVILKIFRKISNKTGYFLDFWYGGWKTLPSHIRQVIVFATDKPDPIFYLRKKYPSLRIILWYWNPVFRCFDPREIPDNLCEIWSFDPEDCRKFQLKFNTTFYFRDFKIRKVDIKQDVLFLGLDKGRATALFEMEKKLRAEGLSTFFHIIPDDSPKKVSYREYLNYLQESKAILDLVQEGQEGLTLRVMEALFFKKKLITDNISIRESVFYNPNNVFVIGSEAFSGLEHFLASPYEELDEEIIQSYEFNNWLNRFDS